jgi:class 3 adenylate cyclase
MAIALNPVKRPAERRQATVIFCDLVNSTSLAERLDPEELMELIDAVYGICDEIISAHSGYLAQYLGDGILAYFGYPDTSEEAAPNAVRAALRLRDSIQGIASPTGDLLSCRIGIATGSVVINTIQNIEEPRRAGLMMGETPNLAARLQSIAAPHQILVSEPTYRLTSGLFHYQSHGRRELKGFEKAVPIYGVVEETGITSRSQARLRDSDLPLIGRQRELEVLLQTWQQVLHGQGQLVLIQGEAGIGKSRLAAEFRQSLMDQGHLQMSWYCGPNTRESLLHPIAEQIRRAAGFRKGETDESRRDKLATLLERYGATEARSLEVLADLIGLGGTARSSLTELTPEKRRQIRLETLLGMLQTWSNGQPCLILMEDLHWIDPTTLELLGRLIATTPQQPWMVMATARPEFIAHWPSDGAMIHLNLERLNRSDSELICSSLNAEKALSPQLTRRIVERCDGIPLYVEETTKSMLELLRTQGPLGGDGVEHIPETLQDSLVARLDQLGEARRVASIGATIGRSFTYELLEAVSSQPESVLRKHIEAMLSAGLLQTSDQTVGEAYEFKHALIRDAAYENMLKRERQSLHERIATILSQQFPELVEAEPQLLAFHFTRAGAFAEAIPHWVNAGQRAAGMASHVEAVQHFQTALDLLRREASSETTIPSTSELSLLLSLATSLQACLGYTATEVGRVLEEARSLTKRLQDRESMFWVLRGICNISIVACDLSKAAWLVDQCITLSEESCDPIHHIESNFAAGYVKYITGSIELAHHHLTSSINLYQSHNGWQFTFPSPHDPMVGALVTLAMVSHATGDQVEAEANLLKAQAHAHRLGKNYEMVYALSYQLLHHILEGRYLDALAVSSTVLEISEEYGYSLWQAITKVYRGVSLAHTGLADLEDALKLTLQGMKEQDNMGAMALRGYRLAEIAMIHARSKNYREAKYQIDSAVEEVHRLGESYFIPLVYIRKAEIESLSGSVDRDQVIETLDHAKAVAIAQGARGFTEIIKKKIQHYSNAKVKSRILGQAE